jgi:hypothetical protein
MLVNSSIGYRGQLVIVVVPKGSTWSLTISDLPVRAPSEIGPGSPHVANQHDGVWGHKPASERRAAFEANAFPRKMDEAAHRA